MAAGAKLQQAKWIPGVEQRALKLAPRRNPPQDAPDEPGVRQMRPNAEQLEERDIERQAAAKPLGDQRQRGGEQQPGGAVHRANIAPEDQRQKRIVLEVSR